MNQHALEAVSVGHGIQAVAVIAESRYGIRRFAVVVLHNGGQLRLLPGGVPCARAGGIAVSVIAKRGDIGIGIGDLRQNAAAKKLCVPLQVLYKIIARAGRRQKQPEPVLIAIDAVFIFRKIMCGSVCIRIEKIGDHFSVIIKIRIFLGDAFLRIQLPSGPVGSRTEHFFFRRSVGAIDIAKRIIRAFGKRTDNRERAGILIDMHCSRAPDLFGIIGIVILKAERAAEAELQHRGIPGIRRTAEALTGIFRVCKRCAARFLHPVEHKAVVTVLIVQEILHSNGNIQRNIALAWDVDFRIVQRGTSVKRGMLPSRFCLLHTEIHRVFTTAAIAGNRLQNQPGTYKLCASW